MDTVVEEEEEEEHMLEVDVLERLQDVATRAFLQERSLVAHQLDSFDNFCESLPSLFAESEEFRVEHEEQQKYALVKFSGVYLKKPEVAESKEKARPLLPEEARLRNMNYSACMYANMSINVYGKGQDNLLQENDFQDVRLGEIPCMVKSKLCHTYAEGEQVFDRGAYFIIQGAEKVVISQEDRFLQRCMASRKDGDWKAYVGWPGRGLSLLKNIISVKLKEKETGPALYVSLPGVADVPIFIALRALGDIKDRRAFELLHAAGDDEVTDILMPSFREAEQEILVYLERNDEMDEDFRDADVNLQYIGSKIKLGGKNPILAATKLIEARLFPGSGGKAALLGYLVHYLCSVYLGRRVEQDSLKTKRIDCVGSLFARQLKFSMKRLLNETFKKIKMYLSRDRKMVDTFLLDATTITKDFKIVFRNNTWAGAQDSKLVAALQRNNHTQTLSNLRHVRAQTLYTGKVGDARYPNKSHYGRFCPVETPEGEDCGIKKTLAVFAVISSEHSEEHAVEHLNRLGMLPIKSFPQQQEKIFLNGTWVGLTADGDALCTSLRNARRQGLLHREVEIGKNKYGEIHIFTDGGRVLRPVFVVSNGRIPITRKLETELLSDKLLSEKGKMSFEYLLKNGIVELLGPEEEEGCTVAPSFNALQTTEAHLYTHMELHPASVLSVSAALIPFLHHNQSIRVTHQAQKHGKQAIGIYWCDPGVRCDKTSHQLYYPQKLLVSTRFSQLLNSYKNMNEFMNGQSCVVAVACYTGYNQEDSIILNQASLDRGLFKTRHETTWTYSIGPTNNAEEFQKPCQADVGGYRHAGALDKIDSDGFPQIGASLESGNVVIGKVCPSEGRYRDNSIQLKTFESGTVHRVVLANGINDTKIARVQLGKARVPQVGDKFSSLHGQKGVVGMCIDQEDMFFTQQGIVPDIIINPHAFPTRQTLGQLMESVAGKAAAANFKTSSTPFDDNSPEELANALHRAGFQRWGAERVYNGFYGTGIKSLVFIGINFYQQLTHMAEDRIKWRRLGRTHPITRQPIGDRQRYGGIKFSEMERDCLIGHGAAATVQERMFRLSDHHQVYVCVRCHRMANIGWSGASRRPLCKWCDKNSTFALVEIPYSCKLLIQELNSMCIDVRLITQSQ